MKIMKTVKAIGIVVIVAFLAVLAGMGFLFLDVASYTATGSGALSPGGAPAGSALVVYDPGVTGAAKDAAADIAGDLQAKGYRVELAGVRSAAAANASGYDVIAVGGPTYVGNISGSIRSYLRGLEPSSGAKVGIFATGGIAPESDDPAYMLKFVAGLPAGGPLKVRASAKIVSGGDTGKQCSEFVAKLLQ